MFRKTALLIIGSLILLTAAVSCSNQKDVTEQSDVIYAYFPTVEGMVYQYSGSGNEFASFTREIKYVQEPFVQIHENNGGTIVATVYKLAEGSLGTVMSRPEYYKSDNLLAELNEEEKIKEIVLKTPLKKGNSWQSGNTQREFTATGEVVTVPAGTFYDVLQVKVVTETEQGKFTDYEYYAKNIGLIKSESRGENYHITAELKSYGINKAEKAADTTFQDPAE